METVITRWEDSPREDLNMLPEMITQGWQVMFHDNDILHKRITLENPPAHSITFHKGINRIWQCREGWQTAQLICGSFVNHGGTTGIKEGKLIAKFPDTKGFIPSLKECLTFLK